MKTLTTFLSCLLTASTCLAQPTPTSAEQIATQYCQTMIAYRVGSLMNIRTEKTEKLTGMEKWLVTGTIRQTPELTFACLVKGDEQPVLEKLELFELKKQ